MPERSHAGYRPYSQAQRQSRLKWFHENRRTISACVDPVTWFRWHSLCQRRGTNSNAEITRFVESCIRQNKLPEDEAEPSLCAPCPPLAG